MTRDRRLKLSAAVLAVVTLVACAVPPRTAPAERFAPGDFVAYVDLQGLRCAEVWRIDVEAGGVVVLDRDRRGAVYLPAAGVQRCIR